MSVFLKFAVLVSFLSASRYFADSTSFKNGRMFKSPMPRRSIEADLSGDPNPVELSTSASPGVTNPTTKSPGGLGSHKSSSSVLSNNQNTSTKSICEGTAQNELARCQGGFLPWNRNHGTKNRNPCVKRIVKTYMGNRDEIVTEVECRRASFYCPQSFSRMGLCQAIKIFHSALGKILIVGCKCKPRTEL